MDVAKQNALTALERYVIEHKGTEPPFSGEHDDFWQTGTCVCRRCDAELYRSEDKFHAHCGRPAFDDEIAGAVRRLPDPDGMRIEIECVNCGGHLRHVFEGEALTPKDTRPCVNALSMRFASTAADSAPLARFWSPLGAAAIRHDALPTRELPPRHAGG